MQVNIYIYIYIYMQHSPMHGGSFFPTLEQGSSWEYRCAGTYTYRCICVCMYVCMYVHVEVVCFVRLNRALYPIVDVKIRFDTF